MNPGQNLLSHEFIDSSMQFNHEGYTRRSSGR